MITKIESMRKFVEVFKKTSPLWAAMAKTKEDSPWHREESVAIHTDMVCSEFEKFAEGAVLSEDTFVITYLSLLFHDTGKPPCKVVKFKPERGHYNAFHGHELYSARLWENYFVCNFKQLFESWLSVEEAYKIMWMIENHLPYDYMGNSTKMDYLRTAIANNLGANAAGFGYHLLGDTYGRISDDATAKRLKTVQFVEMMMAANVLPQREIKDDAPVLWLLIGASGSGKSTFCKTVLSEDVKYFSYDHLRIQHAKDKIPAEMAKHAGTKKEYSTAWGYCDKHRSQFMHFADVEFIKHIKNYDSIVVDNVNGTRKVRAKFIAEAKKRGYRVKAVMFPVGLQEVVSRQTSRDDKEVPIDAVERQYMGISIPWVGVEVDELVFYTGNFGPKVKF